MRASKARALGVHLCAVGHKEPETIAPLSHGGPCARHKAWWALCPPEGVVGTVLGPVLAVKRGGHCARPCARCKAWWALCSPEGVVGLVEANIWVGLAGPPPSP